MIAKRIADLEKKLGTLSRGDGPCRCPYPGLGVVIWPDGSKVDHGPCPRCGCERPTFRVCYDDPIQ
jgi:hypothetical protein